MQLSNYDNNISIFKGDCNCISLTNQEDEGQYRWKGCDIEHTDSDLGNTVFEVSGYNPITKEIENLGYICSACLCYIYNADIPDFIETGD